VTIKQIPTGSFFYFQPAAIYAEENIVTIVLMMFVEPNFINLLYSCDFKNT